MAIHRIGNTLLVDRVDVVREPSPLERGDIKALPKKKNPNLLLQQSMYSKFLYYSVESEVTTFLLILIS